MFTFLGSGDRYCDGFSRRSFLKLGALGMGGLSLPQILQAEEKSRTGGSKKSVIMVYLSGGMSHLDTFDLKPNAPSEIRGEFNPIPSRIPGLMVSELLPMLAMSLDKIAVIRSLVGQRDEHSSFQSMTGFTMSQSQREGKPHFGSIISKVLGPCHPIVPPFIDLSPVMQHKPYNTPGPGNLGSAYSPSRMDGDDRKLLEKDAAAKERLGNRRGLLGQFDQMRSSFETQEIEGMDHCYQRAFDLLSSDRVAKALDVNREDPRLRDRYGKGSPKHLGDGAPMWNDQLLIARRLIEAGSRVVTVSYGFWDTHGNNFKYMRRHTALFDQGISALVEDIYARGLDKDVTVIVWGEFGRTPKINKDAGRDHWAPVNFALMSGGGMNVGQVIGATDKSAAYAASMPIHYQDVLATIYKNLGIDPHTFIQDRTARPIPILPGTATPIRQLS